MIDHLSVPRKEAQNMLKKLRDIDAVDCNYKVIAEGDSVLIPLKVQQELPRIAMGYFRLKHDGRPDLRRSVKPVKFSGSYDVIGSIAIMKRGEMDDPEKLARNIMESRKNIRSVFLDKGVKGEFRTRDLELICGENSTKTMYRENGMRFAVDVGSAYFSPRLATERYIVAKGTEDGERIIDMFAGIGPFSITIASMKKCEIYAFDSNPAAIKMMNENIAMNRIYGQIFPQLGDSSHMIENYRGMDRIIMNLPHSSFSFIEKAYASLRRGGKINYYEILDDAGLEKRMERFRDMGLELRSKRIVHGYSKFLNVYSMELVKTAV